MVGYVATHIAIGLLLAVHVAPKAQVARVVILGDDFGALIKVGGLPRIKGRGCANLRVVLARLGGAAHALTAEPLVNDIGFGQRHHRGYSN